MQNLILLSILRVFYHAF